MTITPNEIISRVWGIANVDPCKTGQKTSAQKRAFRLLLRIRGGVAFLACRPRAELEELGRRGICSTKAAAILRKMAAVELQKRRGLITESGSEPFKSKAITGNPDPKHISTSYVERHNWSVRTSMRRYARLSSGFSRKVENHAAAVALNYFAYNFIQIHRTLRVSPAMAAAVTDHLWSVADLVARWESEERRVERAA